MDRTSSPTMRRGRLAGDVIGFGVVLVAYGLFCVLSYRAGMPAQHLARVTASVAFFQLLPGMLVWRCLRPARGWLYEDVAFGFACGFALSVVSQSLAGLLDSRWVALGLPLVVTATLLALPGTRARLVRARQGPTPAWLGVVTAVSSVGAIPGLVNYLRQNPLTWDTGFRSPQVDQYFQLAMAQQLLHRGPGEWPLVAGESMSYHWFAHAWMAHVSAGSGVGPDEVLLRFAPVLSPFLVVVAVTALGLRISGRPLVAAVAVVLTMLGGTGSLWRARGLAAPLMPESPTLALSVPPLLALVAIVAMRWRGQPVLWSRTALALLVVIASGTKGSATPLVIAGAALALVAMLIWRRDHARVVAGDLVVMVAALLATMKVVFNGSANALLVDPVAALRFSWPVASTGNASAWVLGLGALTMLLTGLSRAALGFAVIGDGADRAGRRDPLLWLLLGAAIAGACAPLLFVQPGASQFYFRLSAIPLGALASAVAAIALRERLGSRSPILLVVTLVGGFAAWALPSRVVVVARNHPGDMLKLLCVGAVILAVVAGVGYLITRTLGALAASMGAILMTGVMAAGSVAAKPFLPVSPPPGARAAGAIGVGQVEAARFIGKHSAHDDMVMTNRHCTATPERRVCDSRYFMVAAQSGRQMLLEGWGYSPTITARYPEGRRSITAPYWDASLQRLNDDFFTSPTADAARALWARGVRWIYVDKLYPHAPSLEPFANRRFDNADAAAWQLVEPSS